jgi:hypothetical protein
MPLLIPKQKKDCSFVLQFLTQFSRKLNHIAGGYR